MKDTTSGFDIVEVERSVMSKKQKEKFKGSSGKVPFRFLTKYQKRIIKGKTVKSYFNRKK